MGLAVNWVAAALLALTIAFYVFVYTIWLKRRTPQNIVIGGAAGAFPPMIGWAAVTGDIGWGAIALFAIIFFWTPPHFWALSLYRAGEYAAAGVPMLPVVAGPRETKRQMLLYTLVLWPATLAPWLLGCRRARSTRAGAVLLSAVFTGTAIRVWRDDERAQRAADVRFFAALSVPDLQPAAGRASRRVVIGFDGGGSPNGRAASGRSARATARSLPCSSALVALFYAITIVRMAEASGAVAGDRSRRRNGATVLLLASVVAGMVGLSFASVPLYRLFCQATGFGGTTQRPTAAPAKAAADALITVRFDAETAPDLDWEFRPLTARDRGASRASRTRSSSAPSTATASRSPAPATYNVTPTKAGIYFDKLQCFCFTEQRLAPGESVDMGVVFFVDPDMLTDPSTSDVRTITLSYTMFRAPEPARSRPASAAPRPRPAIPYN